MRPCSTHLLFLGPLALTAACAQRAPSGAEDVFIECMRERGFEVTEADLTPGRENIELAPHDRPLAEVVEATTACEQLALGGSPIDISGDDLQQDVGTVVDQVTNGGIVALQVRSGVSTWAVAGTADLDGSPLVADSLFNVASATKAYTATLIYRLEDQGSLDTSAALSSFLPALDYGPEVTLDALLSHRSGIPDYVDNPAYLTDVLAAPNRIFTADELLAYAGFESPAPAGSYDYSNTGYLLLGMVIEEVTGEALADVFRSEIVDPLGLLHTTLVDPPRFPSDLASGWVDPASLGLPADPPPPVMPIAAALSGCQADCGVLTTAAEARMFYEALFDGTLLSKEALAEMTSSHGDAPHQGRGLEIYEGAAGSTYGHGGGGAGYSARIAYDPVSGDATVLLANHDALAVDALFEAYRP